MRSALRVLFWSLVSLLALSLLFTIIGSSINTQALLDTGIVGWLITCLLLFAWLVLWFWTRAKRYKS